MCPDCNTELSDKAEKCIKCGRPIKKSVGFLLGLGIFLFPLIFAWFTLRKGYSVLAKVISFLWLLLILAVALSAPTVNSTNYTSTETDTTVQTTVEDVMSVKISKLLKDYRDNEINADNQYKSKTIEVTGYVDSIKKDLFGGLFITVGTGKSFEIPQVQASFDKSSNQELAQLNKSELITIVCQVQGLMMNVILKECKIKK